LRPANWLALLSRTFTFELALAGSPRTNVEYDYVGKQSIPTTGLSPASPTALWAADPDPDSFRPQGQRLRTQNPKQTRPQPPAERGWADKADRESGTGTGKRDRYDIDKMGSFGLWFGDATYSAGRSWWNGFSRFKSRRGANAVVRESGRLPSIRAGFAGYSMP